MTLNDEFNFSISDRVESIYSDIDNRTITLGIYLQELGSFVKSQNKKINLKHKRNDELLAENEWANWCKDIIPNLKNSFIMNLFSVYENSMDNICNEISNFKNIPLTRNDLSGGVLLQFKKYLKVFGGFTMPVAEKWNTIEAINQVRNVLIHGQGDILKSHVGSLKKIRKLEKDKIGLDLVPPNFINAIWKNPKNEGSTTGNFPKRPKRPIKSSRPADNHCIAITADFCDFALNEIDGFFQDLKQQHFQLIGGLKIIK